MGKAGLFFLFFAFYSGLYLAGSVAATPACRLLGNVTDGKMLKPAADSFRLVRTLPLQARFVTADNLGQLYLITPRNAVEKYAPDGRLLSRYTNNRLGMATMVDVSNPLKVLVWYADFRTAVFLDRNLTALGELNLVEAGFPEVRTVAAAADGQLWLYDEVAFQLRKVSPEGSVRFESQALNLLMPERMAFTCLRDDGHDVWAADPALGLFRFDVFAQFQQRLPRSGIATFVLHQHALEYADGDALQIEQPGVFNLTSRPLPTVVREPGVSYWLAPGCLLVQRAGGVEVWE